MTRGNGATPRRHPTEDSYRGQWTWDSTVRGSHAVDCYPAVGSCPYVVYMKDGKIAFQEAAGIFPPVEEGVPDFNPMGCQKGACWDELLHAPERLLHPMKRVGERGSGAWERITWDQALTEIADSIIDAIQEVGPESVFSPNGANACAWGVMSQRRFASLTGFPVADFDTDVADFSPGMYLTYGKLTVPSEDDYAHSGLIIIWHCNPAYTRIPFFHFLLEARYKGAEIVLIAPDTSPSAMHADYHVPLNVGSDAALCLAMCRVIIDEGLADVPFLREQTDLPLLVRLDNERFLRACDLAPDGRDDQFYVWDERARAIAEAPRGTLDLGDVSPALEGEHHVTLADGSKVRVAPAFARLRGHLRDYAPEQASQACGVHPDVIRMLARKVAAKRTHVYEGLGTGKYYHGDLMGRAMYLLLAVTGNWGRKGTGPAYWSVGPSTAGLFDEARRTGGKQELANILAGYRAMIDLFKAQDPSRTDEIASIEIMRQMAVTQGHYVPPLWWWYYHVGFRDVWNRRDWHDPSMKREFDDYFNEAMQRGWWDGVAVPGEDKPPRVMIAVGDNLLRRGRGGQTMFRQHLWPKLNTIVSVDVRMSTTALFSDYVLPAAQQYERPSAMGLSHTLFFTMLDKAVEPAGEALPEWQVFRLLSRKLGERGRERGVTEYQDAAGRTFNLDTLEDVFTAGGAMVDEEQMTAEGIEGSTMTGTLPAGTTIETMRKKGIERFTGWGIIPYSQNYQTPIEPDSTMAPFRHHLEQKLPYPTLTRRAQFYIDHDWFIEAREHFPTHKAPPKMGGDYPFTLTGGHNRWSIHANNITNRRSLQTHRGHPHIVMNTADAARRGIADDEEVRVHNDVGQFTVQVKLSPSVRPGQVICYNGWDHIQFRDWSGPSNLEGAMVKWLGFAGGYGHLFYWPFMWTPIQVDRATRVDVSKIG